VSTPVSTPAGTGPFIEARGLSWRVGPATIVDSIDCAVNRGELLGVIGPNGAGKTTLLRLLAGLLRPTAGSVRIEGADLAAMASRGRARRIAFMSQEAGSSFPYTVMEILLMGRYPHLGRFEKETAGDFERARRTLSYVGCAGLEERAFAELSGGERQLVLFARALVQDTDALVLDEPSSSLDIRHQDRIFSMAQELAREQRAVVVSVHNLGVAAQYCARLLLLEKGRIAAEGRPEDVLVPAVLDRVYAVRTLVSRSGASGSLSVTVAPQRRAGTQARIHLIGGAGSAVNLTRELYRLGCTLSGGIAHEHDSDELLWRSLGIECASVGAFSRIGDAEVEAAEALIARADLTILCSFPVGSGNIGNLRLALKAPRLVVLRPGREDVPRSFFSPEGKALFDELSARSESLGYEEIVARAERSALRAGDGN
jgi:iron complex transport system ATP-binding protein